MADLWLPVRLNGDVALLKGVCKALVELPGPALDHSFIEEKTHGFADFRRDLQAESWAALVEGSGIAQETMVELAGLVARSRKIITCWAMGLTQHKNAVGNIQMMVNLNLLRGAVGKPGAGLCPVRGHSNVQGDRTVGITCKPKPEFLEALGREFDFTPPTRAGLDTVDTIRAMAAGDIEVFIALGGNFLAATPDTAATAQALGRCRLTVQISTKLNRSHLVNGREALILPCLGRTEADLQSSGPQFVTVENSMGKVHRSQGRLEPASPHLKSEAAIVAGIAQAALNLDWGHLLADYSRIRQSIERVIPGFTDYNQRVAGGGGFYLPNGPRQGQFPTSSGKAHFTVHPVPQWNLAEGELLMMTIRSHDQFNTTIYGLDDRYRGIRQERRVVLLSEADMAKLGLHKGQVVHLEGPEGRRVSNFQVVPYPIPRGCCATYFPECNPLIPLDSVAAKSNTPTSKSVVIRILT
jgi:molybdopterin-dependent oxidoreductase alpha subunit